MIQKSPSYQLAVVIPSYNETTLIPVLNSLLKCSKSDVAARIYVVVNAPNDAADSIKQRNERAYYEVVQWKSENENPDFIIDIRLYNDLPPKKAGVGMARKLGMDEAAHEFRKEEIDGIIACLDADCLVQSNYFKAIYDHFQENKDQQAASIYFEHRFDESDAALKEAIIQYEIHLRYYKQAIAICNLPYDFHTVGSSMVVKSEVYLKSGGMNTKKAGEDFYFLQKLFTQYPFGEINTTVVYPLGRKSDRVPFGTGAAMNKWISEDKVVLETYSFTSFLQIKEFIRELFAQETAERWNDFLHHSERHVNVISFLKSDGFFDAFERIRSNVSSPDQLAQQFVRYFNNFRLLKCLNYLRSKEKSKVSILDEANKLLLFIGIEPDRASESLLDIFRKMDKLANEKRVEKLQA